MTPDLDLIVFQGSYSQTGVAFIEKFPDIDFENTTYNFEEINLLVRQKSLKVVLPIWNSHFGEITVSHALTMIFEEVARIYMLWPQKIVFECLKKNGDLNPGAKIVSVSVASSQCSKFIESHDFEFHPVGSTTIAYKSFEGESDFDAVLCAPGANVDNFDLFCPDAANPLNFTTFALLASMDSVNWSAREWRDLNPWVETPVKVFAAVQMPFFQTFTDSQEELFNSLIEDAERVEDVPKVLFVAIHEYSSCRLLIEADDEWAPPDILNEDGADEMINILTNVGETKEIYSASVAGFLEENNFLSDGDFFEHEGTSSCFFACPALGIFTHGFDRDATRFVVQQVIKKCFELLDRGIVSTTEQKVLFDKYKSSYREDGVDFIKFKILGG